MKGCENMDEKIKENSVHKLSMLNREKLTVTGVEDVGSFDEDQITVYTTEGMMTLKGVDFKINRLNVEDGELEIEGEVDSIVYSSNHKSGGGSFFGRIFK